MFLHGTTTNTKQIDEAKSLVVRAASAYLVQSKRGAELRCLKCCSEELELSQAKLCVLKREGDKA